MKGLSTKNNGLINGGTSHRENKNNGITKAIQREGVMSLGIVVNSPEGLVLAAESRVTLTATTGTNETIHVNFDNATKLLTFNEPHNYVGAVTYGLAAIGNRTANSFLPEFTSELPLNRLPIQEYTQRLSDFFMRQWNTVMPTGYAGPSMTFVIGGFNEQEPYGVVYTFDIPSNPPPRLQGGSGNFGLSWGGQREFVDRLIQGFDHQVPVIINSVIPLTQDQNTQIADRLRAIQMQIPLQSMPLQDCVDLAIFFIRTTILGQKLTVGIRGCGGPIDVAIITRRDGLRYVQQKQIYGETQNRSNPGEDRLFHDGGGR